jgi:hypothetical protein
MGQSRYAGLGDQGFKVLYAYFIAAVVMPRQIKCSHSCYGPVVYRLTSLGTQEYIYKVRGPK